MEAFLEPEHDETHGFEVAEDATMKDLLVDPPVEAFGDRISGRAFGSPPVTAYFTGRP